MKEVLTHQHVSKAQTMRKSDTHTGPDRFDLEQAILTVWGLDDDLDALYGYLYETDADADTVANAVLGAKVLHTARCTKLWGIFTKLIETKQFVSSHAANSVSQLQSTISELRESLSELREDNAKLLADLHESYENCESIVKYEGLGPGQSQQGMSLREQLASAIRLRSKEVSEGYLK